jgi:hypothetical protein
MLVLPAAFRVGLVGALGHYAVVSLPLVGMVPGAGALGLGQRSPQAPGRSAAARAEHPCHQMANQSHFLRCLRPTNVHILSNSHPFKRRGSGLLVGRICAYFLPTWPRSGAPPGQAHDGALRDAHEQQLFHLRVLSGLARGHRLEPGLVAAGRAQVFTD